MINKMFLGLFTFAISLSAFSDELIFKCKYADSQKENFYNYVLQGSLKSTGDFYSYKGKFKVTVQPIYYTSVSEGGVAGETITQTFDQIDSVTKNEIDELVLDVGSARYSIIYKLHISNPFQTMTPKFYIEEFESDEASYSIQKDLTCDIFELI